MTATLAKPQVTGPDEFSAPTGSGTLVATLLANDLVDELRLMVFPTILGRGKRLFPDGIDRQKFHLVEAKTVGPDGVQIQIYEKA